MHPGAPSKQRKTIGGPNISRPTQKNRVGRGMRLGIRMPTIYMLFKGIRPMSQVMTNQRFENLIHSNFNLKMYVYQACKSGGRQGPIRLNDEEENVQTCPVANFQSPDDKKKSLQHILNEAKFPGRIPSNSHKGQGSKKLVTSLN